MTQADKELTIILMMKGWDEQMAIATVGRITTVINGSASDYIRMLGESLVQLANMYPKGTGHLPNILQVEVMPEFKQDSEIE